MKRKISFFAIPLFFWVVTAHANPPPFPVKNGIIPLTPQQEEYLSNKVVQIKALKPNKIALARSLTSPGAMPGIASAVTNWQYLPKVSSQGGQGSCAAWASCYYYKTYQESREHSWGNPDYTVNPEHVISPAFCYNLANNGEDSGSNPLWIMQMLVDHGAATWQNMPYNDVDYTTWPSQSAWRNALPYRAQSVATIDLRSDAGITALKQHLANGDLAVIAISVTSNLEYDYPNDSAGVNSQVLYANSGAVLGGHALAVIGYDDNKAYNDGTGIKYGAFKLVNSWGTNWGISDPNLNTGGFLWISYNYMRDLSWGSAWTMIDRVNYQPAVYGTFGLNHPKRGDLNVYVLGGDDQNNPDWTFNALPNLGGDHEIAQNITVDLSLYNPNINGKFWLKVNDSALNADTGQIIFMSVQKVDETENISNDTPKNTQNGNDVYVQLYKTSTVLNPVFTQIGISSLTAGWDLIPGANYTAVLSSGSNYSGIVSSVTQSANSLTVTGLSPGTKYYFQVKISSEPDVDYIYNRVSTSTAGSPWSSAGAMLSVRSYHTATLLPNGKVFVVGDYSGAYSYSAEIYDPDTNTWSNAASMLYGRFGGHTATLLPNGKVLVVGGNNGVGLSSAEIYDPDTNTWASAGAMANARSWHTATLLPNGKVLVAGGYNGGELSSAEIYDPDTNTWAGAGVMSAARSGHTATLLPNGKVLVTGGSTGGQGFSSTELYDPNTNIWSNAASMLYGRSGHTATLLPNGKVLVAGRTNYPYPSAAEIYNPNTNTWSSAGAMSSWRSDHTATLLPNGKVLVVGGDNYNYNWADLSSAEIYDQNTNIWTSTVPMAFARHGHTLTLLPNGKALVAGGGVASAELFSDYSTALTLLNPAPTQVNLSSLTVTWALIPGANYTVVLSTDANFNNILSSVTQSANTKTFVGLLSAKKFYFEVKLSTESEWAYVGNRISTTTLPSTTLSWTGETNYVSDGLDPEIGTSTTTFTYRVKYTNVNNAAPANGYPKVHIRKTGGEIPGSPFTMSYVSGNYNTGAIYSYSQNLATWENDYTYYFEAYDLNNSLGVGSPTSIVDAPDVFEGLWTGVAPMSSTRKYHVSTLLPNGKVLVTGGAESSAEVFDPKTNTWSSAGSMSVSRYRHTATSLSNGKVLVAGGSSGYYYYAEIYDPDTNTWARTDFMYDARSQHTATLLPDGSVLVAGGTDGTSFLSSAEIYDLYLNSWVLIKDMISPRSGHTATLLSNGKVLVAGGGTSSAEVFDPKTYTWSSAGSMSSIRSYHTATLLLNGEVLVVGGSNGGTLSSVEIYNPNTNTWANAAPISAAPAKHSATLLPDGKVLITGGFSSDDGWWYKPLSSAELYDPVANTWGDAGSMRDVRFAHTSTLLPNGKVLVAGGEGMTWPSSPSSVEIFSYYQVVLTALNPEFPQVAQSSLTATWALIPGANYTAVLSADANFNNILSSVTQSENTKIFTGLSNVTKYYFEVKVSSETEWAYVGNRVSTSTTLAPPINIAGYALGTSSVSWSWSHVEPVSGYSVYHLGNLISTTTETSYIQTALSPNSPTSIQVEAVSGTISSALIQSTTIYTLASAPMSVSVSTLGRTEMTASWSRSDNPSQTIYELYYSSNSDSGWHIISTTTASVDLKNLVYETTYYIKMRAINGDGLPTPYTDDSTAITLSSPVVTSISGISSGEIMKLTINGHDFCSSDRVRIEKSGQSPINIVPLDVKPDHSGISAEINLAGLLAGSWDVTIYNADAFDSGASGSNSLFVSSIPLGGGITQALIDNTTTSTFTIPGSIEQIIVPSEVIPNGFVLISTNPDINPIMVSSGAIRSASQALAHGYMVIDTREYVAYSNNMMVNSFSSPVTFVINYQDSSPDDGIIDGTNIQERNIKLVTLDEVAQRWVEVPSGEYLVDAINNTVTAKRNHFSVYALLGVSIDGNLTHSKIYPIPWHPTRNDKFGSANVSGCGTGLIFDNLTREGTIRIYTIPGDLVRELSFSAADNGCKAWDGKNAAGRNVASGVYIAIIKNTGAGGGSTTKKLAIER